MTYHLRFSAIVFYVKLRTGVLLACSQNILCHSSVLTVDERYKLKRGYWGRMIYIILLECKRFVFIQRADWIKKRNMCGKSLIFYSPNEDSMPDFNAPKKFLFNERSIGTYDGFVTSVRGKFISIDYELLAIPKTLCNNFLDLFFFSRLS